MENIVIVDQNNLRGKIKAFKRDGFDKIHILADFDRTLIKAFVDGELVSSVLSVLYNQNYLTPDYGKSARELHKKYNAIELDPKIPKEEKKKAMQEWWEKHFDLLIKSRLNKKDIEGVINSGKIIFREGFLELIDFLKTNDIPLVIISSTGLGRDSIEACFKRENRMYKNIHIISNSLNWDKNGYAVSIKGPVIHSLNKDETAIKDFPEIFKEVGNRKNILLLGDSLDDVDMASGSSYNKIIKIGFLNAEIEKNFEYYKKTFDVIILNDGSLNFVNELLREIL